MDELNNVKIFNEDYVNEFVFLPDELLKGSFDIFIRNDAYETGLKEINELVAIIGNTFDENEEIDNLIDDLKELSSSFGKTTKSGIHASSSFSKAFKNGNKITNIPEGLENYKDYIGHDENYKWIKWQLDGQPYLNITENCPYCVSNIEEKKETIVHITEVYDSKSVQNLNNIINIFHRLDKYFSKFIKTKKIGFISLKDVDKVIEELKSRKIDLNLYNHLKSEDTQTTVKIVNSSIDTTLEKVGDLQGEINKQKGLIERLIKEHKTEINSFLKNAGYGYNVDLIDDSEGNYKLKLLHNDIQDEITDVKEHLSFGERNAFSLVLFMYDVLNHSPDLVILDDPISSFDKNKKYAIVDMLFCKDKSLKGKTVLLLTHDFEPIIDMIHHHRDRFEIPNATFLENNHGDLVEKEIQRSDVQTFVEINESNIKILSNQIINKLVYLRRLYEIKNAKGNGYQLISNLMHKRKKPKFKGKSVNRDMTPSEIDSGNNEIQKLIDDFDYSKVLDIINDDKEMKRIYSETESSYEKLHIYRIIFDNKDKTDSSVIKKFINEAFHIENDYIYQLNPRKYQMVPQFVIDECDKAISDI